MFNYYVGIVRLKVCVAMDGGGVHAFSLVITNNELLIMSWTTTFGHVDKGEGAGWICMHYKEENTLLDNI
jgi:hypothetical protein